MQMIHSKVLAFNVALCYILNHALYITAIRERGTNMQIGFLPQIAAPERKRARRDAQTLIDEITQDALRRAALAPTYMESLDITGAALLAVAAVVRIGSGCVTS